MYRTCKKDYSWNAITCIWKNSQYLKSIATSSVILCDKVINAVYNVSSNVANTIPTNMKNTISTIAASTLSINIDKFISDHTTINNHYYLLSICKTTVKTKKCIVVLI